MRRAAARVLVPAVALASGLAAVQPPAVRADPLLTLFRFRGVVQDNVGRPIEGAVVTDGVQTTRTGADGSYTLPEGFPGSYTVSAYSAAGGTWGAPETVLVPRDTTADFTPGSGRPFWYRMTSEAQPAVFSTASGPQRVAVSVTSWAPAGGSCVFVTDSRTGAAQEAQYQSSAAGGQSVWSAALDVPQGTPDGTYSLAAVVKDCASGSRLDHPGSAPTDYRVQN